MVSAGCGQGSRRRAVESRHDVFRWRGRSARRCAGDRVLQKAAEHGEAIASFSLGSIDESGADRVWRDEAKAATWYRKAAGQGLGTAQHRLALMYRDGRGVSRDTAEAIAWFRKAADRGEAGRTIELGVLLSPGHGAVS